MTNSDPPAAAENLITQAATLLDVHDDISRVIGNLTIPTDALNDEYRIRTSKTFDFEPMVRLFLYKEICDYKQAELVRRLQNWQYLRLRFGLERTPTQQAISYTKRRRFDLNLRQFIKNVAEGIREAAEEQDIRAPGFSVEPKPDPDEVADSQIPLHHYVDKHAPDVIRRGQQEVFTAFDTGRSHNFTHEDEVHWEHQAMMSLQDRSGTQAAYRTFNKFRANALSGDTHCRSVKKLGSPDGPRQHTLDEYTQNDSSVPYWRSVADTIQEQYADAINQLLDKILDSTSFTQPVTVAIDTTEDPFHVSPWKQDEDIEPGDERIVVSEKTGYTKVPKEDYPEMVNGGEEKHSYAYEYATLTIVGRGVPIVLAVEPVRENSVWEGEDGESVPKAEIVHRLMEQAKQHVDIHLVMADRGFDSYAVYHVLDQHHDVDYLIPKSNNSEELRELRDEFQEDPFLQSRVERGISLPLKKVENKLNLDADPTVDEGDEYSHDMSLMLVPAERDDWIVDDNTGSTMFVTNREDVSPMDALGFVDRYSNRWDIENEYKMIKPFLPSIASTDYRMRFFAFVFATLVYNLWRLVDHKLKDMASEEFSDYGRGPHEERLDTVIPMADMLASLIVSLFLDGWDPPD